MGNHSAQGKRTSHGQKYRKPRRCSVSGHYRTARNDVPRTSGLGIAVASCGRAGVASVTWLVTLATHGDTGQTVGASCTYILWAWPVLVRASVGFYSALFGKVAYK